MNALPMAYQDIFLDDNDANAWFNLIRIIKGEYEHRVKELFNDTIQFDDLKVFLLVHLQVKCDWGKNDESTSITEKGKVYLMHLTIPFQHYCRCQRKKHKCVFLLTNTLILITPDELISKYISIFASKQNNGPFSLTCNLPIFGVLPTSQSRWPFTVRR